MIWLLIGGLVVVLLGAYLFTNGVEWLGKRLNLSQGVVGSVLAGVGTAMPETMVPIIAIFFPTSEASESVGIGAILGAPFMLSCLTVPLLGVTILLLAAAGRRSPRVEINPALSRIDLGFFLIAYVIAITIAIIPAGEFGVWLRVLAASVLVVLYFVYLKKLLSIQPEGEHAVDPLIFSRTNSKPGLGIIGTQVIAGLGTIILGAHLFVDGIENVAAVYGLSPLIFSLLVTPIATELPEKFNSLIWISQRKDTLAFGNITGAMVFQGTFPVAVGLLGTSWRLDSFGLMSAGLAVLAAALLYYTARAGWGWRPAVLASMGGLYLLYGGYVAFGP